MIVRADTPVSFPVLFSTGHPDAGVMWTVIGPGGTALASGTLVVPANAVSINVAVDATVNALGVGELVSYRDVAWRYTVGGATVYDEVRYALEARLPFGVSPAGVRNKLGVIESDLPDADISLVAAYYALADAVGSSVLQAAALLSGRIQLIVRNAIEALAARTLVPTMVVRIADKESSGTNQYQRQKIDWSAIVVALNAEIGAAQLLLVPSYDPTIDFGPLLILATPSVDHFTG